MREGITLDDPHSEFFPAHFLPDRIGGVCLLLEAIGWDDTKLSLEQLTRCREILHLDTDLTVEELVKEGEH